MIQVSKHQKIRINRIHRNKSLKNTIYLRIFNKPKFQKIKTIKITTRVKKLKSRIWKRTYLINCKWYLVYKQGWEEKPKTKLFGIILTRDMWFKDLLIHYKWITGIKVTFLSTICQFLSSNNAILHYWRYYEKKLF